MSTPMGQKKFFSKPPDAYGEWFSDNLWHLQKSLDCKEVLLKWRGTVGVEWLDVVDDSGNYMQRFSKYAPSIADASYTEEEADYDFDDKGSQPSIPPAKDDQDKISAPVRKRPSGSKIPPRPERAPPLTSPRGSPPAARGSVVLELSQASGDVGMSVETTGSQPSNLLIDVSDCLYLYLYCSLRLSISISPSISIL